VVNRRWGFATSLAVISLAGFALRVAYVLGVRRSKVPVGNDSFFFSEGANLLAQGRGFIQPHVAQAGSIIQAADHPPLYLLWLTIASVVDPGRSTSQVTHMLWSCVLGAGTVVLCGLVGRRVAGPRAGLVAASLAAVYPNLWVHEGMLMSETMSIFTISLVLWSAYRFWDEPTAGRVAWLGICCGLAALTRSELILTLPLLLLPLVVLRQAAWRRRLGWLAVGGGAALATLAPWIAFNFSRFEEPVFMSTNSATTMAAANCDSTYYGDRIGYKDWDCAVAAHEAASARAPGWAGFDQSQRDQHLRPEVVRYVRDHLERVPAVVAARVGRTLKLYGVGFEIDYDNLIHGQERAVVHAGLASWYVAAGLAVVGSITLRRRREVPVFPLPVVPLIVLVTVVVTFAQTRYRAPAEPAVVILAAVAIDAWLPRRRAAPQPDEDAARPAPAPETVSAPA
jgi:4-amino-4-deoxy-L-arabinose transferase-like glycosyltransferase